MLKNLFSTFPFNIIQIYFCEMKYMFIITACQTEFTCKAFPFLVSLSKIDWVGRRCQTQFGTQVRFRWSRDRNNRTAENAFSAPWYFSEMESEPAAGWFQSRFRIEQHSGTSCACSEWRFPSLTCVISHIFLYFSFYIFVIWEFKCNNHIFWGIEVKSKPIIKV